eukprot:1033876-Rhodomonas_salina.4
MHSMPFPILAYYMMGGTLKGTQTTPFHSISSYMWYCSYAQYTPSPVQAYCLMLRVPMRIPGTGIPYDGRHRVGGTLKGTQATPVTAWGSCNRRPRLHARESRQMRCEEREGEKGERERKENERRDGGMGW